MDVSSAKVLALRKSSRTLTLNQTQIWMMKTLRDDGGEAIRSISSRASNRGCGLQGAWEHSGDALSSRGVFLSVAIASTVGSLLSSFPRILFIQQKNGRERERKENDGSLRTSRTVDRILCSCSTWKIVVRPGNSQWFIQRWKSNSEASDLP